MERLCWRGSSLSEVEWWSSIFEDKKTFFLQNIIVKSIEAAPNKLKFYGFCFRYFLVFFLLKMLLQFYFVFSILIFFFRSGTSECSSNSQQVILIIKSSCFFVKSSIVGFRDRIRVGFKTWPGQKSRELGFFPGRKWRRVGKLKKVGSKSCRAE